MRAAGGQVVRSCDIWNELTRGGEESVTKGLLTGLRANPEPGGHLCVEAPFSPGMWFPSAGGDVISSSSAGQE